MYASELRSFQDFWKISLCSLNTLRDMLHASRKMKMERTRYGSLHFLSLLMREFTPSLFVIGYSSFTVTHSLIALYQCVVSVFCFSPLIL